jgi:hypothetical protein
MVVKLVKIELVEEEAELFEKLCQMFLEAPGCPDSLQRVCRAVIAAIEEGRRVMH